MRKAICALALLLALGIGGYAPVAAQEDMEGGTTVQMDEGDDSGKLGLLGLLGLAGLLGLKRRDREDRPRPGRTDVNR